MKNKHKGGSKKDRDRVAVIFILYQKQILKFEMEGKPIPKFEIELPPGYIEVSSYLSSKIKFDFFWKLKMKKMRFKSRKNNES